MYTCRLVNEAGTRHVTQVPISSRLRQLTSGSDRQTDLQAQGHNQKCISRGIFFPPCPYPFFPFPLSLSRHKMAHQIQLRDLGDYKLAVSSPSGEINICSYQTCPRVLNTQKMRSRPGLGRKLIFSVFRAQGTCLVAENVVLFLSNKFIYKLKQIIKFHLFFKNFLSGGGVLTPKTAGGYGLVHSCCKGNAIDKSRRRPVRDWT